MNKLPKITEIIKIEPFKIICRWNTGEILVTDFEVFFKKWKQEEYKLMYPLFDYDNFKYATISSTNTIQWLNVTYELKNFDGTIIKTHLDLCPDVLYSNSKSLKKYKLQYIETIETDELISID